MRDRLPAVLLLLLSWFLPAGAHAEAVQQIAAHAQAVQQTTAHGRAVQQADAVDGRGGPPRDVPAVHPAAHPAAHPASQPAEQRHAALRHVPYPPPAVRAWSPPGVAGGVPGVADVPPAQTGFRHPWAVVVPRAACGAPAGCRPPATPPRAPPSTRH